MPSPRNSRRKVGRVVRRKLADGTVREYRYAAYRPKPRRPASDSLAALIRAYRQSPEWAALAKSTKYNRDIYLLPLERIGHVRARTVKRRDILEIRNGIAANPERGNGAATAFVAAAGSLFSWAVRYEWIDHSPVEKIGTLPHGTLPAWTRAQADQAQAELPEYLRRVVVLARYSGQRRGDLIAMRWDAYDGHSLRLVQGKTGRAMVLPCHPILRAELDEWKRTTTSLFILVNTKNRPFHPAKLSTALPKALQAIGLPPGLNVHGLRKLAATEIADAGGSTHEIAAVTGHKTLGMVQLYTQSADQERLAQDAMGKLLGFSKRALRKSE